MIILYTLSLLILILLNEKFFEKKYEIFLYLIFGILSPMVFFLPEPINYSIFTSNLSDKVFAVSLLCGSALFYLFNLINSDVKEVNSLKRSLLIVLMIGINSIAIKSLILLFILFNFLIKNDDDKVEFKFVHLTTLLFVAISFSPFLNESYWLMSLILLYIVFRVALSKLDLKDVILALLVISNYTNIYSYSIAVELVFYFPAVLMLIPYLISVEERNKLIEKLGNFKPIERLSINVLIKKDNYISIDKVEWKMKHFNIKRLSDRYTLYNCDYNLTFIFVMVVLLVSLFFGVVS